MQSKGRLIRTFPQLASSVPLQEMQSSDLQDSLASTISNLATQVVDGFQPKVHKQNQLHNESRDSTNPGMVTDYLINLLAALGKKTGVEAIKKHTREEILWNNSLLPWRRSGLWLLLRVFIQLSLTRNGGNTNTGNVLYKAFMVLFLSRILRLATSNWTVLGNDFAHPTYAKLLRRLRKLEYMDTGSLNVEWMDPTRKDVLAAHDLMRAKHETMTIDLNESIDFTGLRDLDYTSSLDLTLPELDKFLSRISTLKQNISSSTFQPRSTYLSVPAETFPKVCQGPWKYLAVERWVEDHLQTWMVTHENNHDTCIRLRELIETYYREASQDYKGSPYCLSIMYLTVLELWVACDKSTCALYPLLRDYDPEVDISEIQCLLLPLKSQMKRAYAVEHYVMHRKSNANPQNPSIYSDFGHQNSFAVNYFRNSLELQNLMARIEQDAEVQRDEKRAELARLKEKQENLMKSYRDGKCEIEEDTFGWNKKFTETQHEEKCSRCALKNEAVGLKIDIHEWPLSPDILIAQATIFELGIPQTISNWRDASMYVIYKVLESLATVFERPKHSFTLENHASLSDMVGEHYQNQTVVILSSDKPHVRTHRRRLTVTQNLRDAEVCLENASKYRYYDKHRNLLINSHYLKGDVPKKCLLQMPTESKILEQYTCKPPSSPDGSAPNKAIAHISGCPRHLALAEYRAMAEMPLGHNIIYSKILVQLVNPIVDFTKLETQILISQIIHQLGPSNESVERSTHRTIAEYSFTEEATKQLKHALKRVEENWESWRAVATFSDISKRILSLSSSITTRKCMFEHLSHTRKVCLRWVRGIQERASASTDDKQKSDLHMTAVQIALIGTSTFDVEESFWGDLFRCQSTISQLMELSIIIRELLGNPQLASSQQLSAVLSAWKSLLFRVFPTLRQVVLHDGSGLFHAIRLCWASFQFSSDQLWDSHGDWVYYLSGTLPVHLNLLTAELVVNGQPLNRLPARYLNHPAYRSLFFNTGLDVMPTNEPGMQFSAKFLYRGHKLHFGMSQGDLLITAEGHKECLRLIPSRLFIKRLPREFITNYVHWWDSTNHHVIFRPCKAPWVSKNSSCWKLHLQRSHWQLVQEKSTLIDMESTSAIKISRFFKPLENSDHVHILFKDKSKDIEVRLPRLQLEFSILHGQSLIRSCQYQGMILDINQNIGALHGLKNKMVLRNESQSDQRLVLIPDGDIHYHKSSHHHVYVGIDKNTTTKVYAYTLDSILRRIQDSGDLQSKLFLCYLYGITSHCLPDHFTGSTGLESAMVILESAAVRSFPALTQDNATLLDRIAELSPARVFYPLHLKAMQQITWDPNLSALSQHPKFNTAVLKLYRHFERTKLFFPNAHHVKQETTPRVNVHLEQRAIARSSTFYIDGFGAEEFTIDDDTIYKPRNSPGDSYRGWRAFIMATLLLRESSAIHRRVTNLKKSLMDNHFKNSIVQGVHHSTDSKELCFDAKWLSTSSDFFQRSWCTLYQDLTSKPSRFNKYDIVTWLSAMAYAESAQSDIIQAFAIFYRQMLVSKPSAPPAQTFDLAKGAIWEETRIKTLISRASLPFESCPEGKSLTPAMKSNSVKVARAEALYEKNKMNASRKFISALQKQWPCSLPSLPTSPEINTYITISEIEVEVREVFQAWFDNKQFLEFLGSLSSTVSEVKVIEVTAVATPPPRVIGNDSRSETVRHLATSTIFNNTPPNVPLIDLSLITKIEKDRRRAVEQPARKKDGASRQSTTSERLESLCGKLSSLANSRPEKQYVAALRASCKSLDYVTHDVRTTNHPLAPDQKLILKKQLEKSSKNLDHLNTLFAKAAIGSTGTTGLGFRVQHSPRLSPLLWLSQLRRESFTLLSEEWKYAIVNYGLAITNLHRARRLHNLADKELDLFEELSNTGHSNWSPFDYPEHLLLEAESGILIREVQEDIAKEIRDSAKNIVCQLNMGEGKSSVIVPVVATDLTDGKRLVRVVVARPQSNQMLQMLISKLGGLLNRAIYHMPFSRDLELNVADANNLRALCEECMTTSGVLLVQPEHILSFKLMGIERLMSDKRNVAQSLLSTQEFFDSTTRDIVDESDENFSVKFELVYTMGTQKGIELSPERWKIIQEIFNLIPVYAANLKAKLPESVEFHQNGSNCFPRVRLLRDDATDQLLQSLAKNILEHGLTGLPIRNQPPKVQAALMRYITETDAILSSADIKLVETSKLWTDFTKPALFLVRGLFAGGNLKFALTSKRWRVNYGLDFERKPHTKLAVPYKSKDSPSLRSEFSHPDVVIIFTLLSYYYSGLSDEELFDSFAHIMNSDQSTVEFDEWVRTASSSLPNAFRQLSGISIKDQFLCRTSIFPYMRYSKSAIDYYLCHLVFPKEMKEFPHKISASGWDIGAKKTNTTTGFSGTNDTSHLLPLSVTNLDLPSQTHTNALVLGYLLHDETSVKMLSPSTDTTDAGHLLHTVSRIEPEVRVILDVGAFILEMKNLEVARKWLSISSAVQAVIFFQGEELSVLDRNQHIEPLQTSPFAKQPHLCIVYLDEAHTRGTDLKLPRNYRAAVTLGANLTKDRLVQACMRMRKLGKGQSVVFMVPAEISTKIHELKNHPGPIEVADVLCWSVVETWRDLSRSMPLWAMQGLQFEKHKGLIHGTSTTKEEAQRFLEEESQSLEVRYRPGKAEGKIHVEALKLDMSSGDVKQILARCSEYGTRSFQSASLQEEQERELAPELKEEKQVQRPPSMDPLPHKLHAQILSLVKTGRLPKQPTVIKPAFQALMSTSAAKLFDLSQFPHSLWVTWDFIDTVETPAKLSKDAFITDSYQRSVQWVLSVPHETQETIEFLVIISPFEANLLYPIIRETAKVTLHLFSARSNASFNSLDHLTLYNVGRAFNSNSVDSSLRAQLNLFAGSLYFRSIDEYKTLCQYLGLLEGTAQQGQEVSADGFITPPVGKWELQKSPVPFLRVLLIKIRREGEGMEKTHMGKVLGGVRLSEHDFHGIEG